MNFDLLRDVLNKSSTSNFIEEDIAIENFLVSRIFLFAAELNDGEKRRAPIPCYDSEYTGLKWMLEIMCHPHPARFYNMFNMSANTFLLLCNMLHDTYGLRASPKMDLIDSVGMFIFIVTKSASYRTTCERFQHSPASVSLHFYRVLEAIERMSPYFIYHLEDMRVADVPTHIQNNNMYYPFFKDCIGAVDGTHVGAITPHDQTVLWCGRKGAPTQNILGVCDIYMRFVYIAAGYEGRVHDTRVLATEMNAEHRHFPVAPDGKYYLADSGYPNMKGFLTPYKRLRYHFQEFRSTHPPKNAEEKFNKVHSSLRSVIERSFGVLKKRFHILKDTRSFHLETQPRIVATCAVVHNFIRQYDREDELFNSWRSPNADMRVESDFSSNGDSSEDKSSDEGEQSQPPPRLTRRRRRKVYHMRCDHHANSVRDEIRDYISYGKFPTHFRF